MTHDLVLEFVAVEKMRMSERGWQQLTFLGKFKSHSEMHAWVALMQCIPPMVR